MNQRRYSRVEMDCSTWLTCENSSLQPYKVCNLSMGGVCFFCKSTLEPGDTCIFELHDFDRAYYYSARVAWKKGDRLALECVDIPPDSNFYLQTMILSHVDNPIKLVEEF